MLDRPIVQINLWDGFGGSEVYTRFLSIALQRLGIRPLVVTHARAAHWRRLQLGDCDRVELAHAGELESVLPKEAAILLANSPLPAEIGARVRQRHTLVTFAHQPVYLKEITPYLQSHLVPCVSLHVLRSAQAARLPAYPRPLYGVADVDRLRDGDDTLTAASKYAWDTHKVRDRVLGALERIVPRGQRIAFERAGPITLGIVSRIAGIKQFPVLFKAIAPVLARHPQVRLEIFGAGGFAAVRDLKRALAPIRDRVRFWGEQPEVRAVYRSIDFLLLGLPEREGMGRNALEAQVCGVPVLAVDAPPFTETIIDGATGAFYDDPRVDGGADFERLLSEIERGRLTPDPLAHPQHLARFGLEVFTDQAEQLLLVLEKLRASGHGNRPVAEVLRSLVLSTG